MISLSSAGSKLRRRAYRILLAALAGSMLVGCADKLYDDPTYSKSNYEAGRILLSERTLVAWDDIKDQLSPNFGTLSGATALADVLPTTQVANDQLTAALGVALKAGLPSTTEALTKTTDLATGAVTGSDVVTKSSGTAPASTASPPSTTLTTLQAVPDDLKKLGDDPVLKYQLASGLIQQVALLDNEMKKIELASDKKAFLVGLDLDVQPYKRDQPYDVFVDISLYPYQQIFPQSDAPTEAQPVDGAGAQQGDGAVQPAGGAVSQAGGAPAAQKAGDPKADGGAAAKPGKDPCEDADLPEVMPLMEMDNLEASVHSNTVENVTQLALALQATMQGVGGALDASYRRDLIRSLLGKDRNSLFTMGKSSVNTLAVRIGAVNQVKVEREMQAQSHRIYTLVLVPNDYLKCKTSALHVVAQTTLIDSKSGAKLETITDDQYKAYVVNALSQYGWANTNLPDYVDALSMAVAARDFGRFITVLQQAAVALKLPVPNYVYPDVASDDDRRKLYIRYFADTLWQDMQHIDSSYGLVYEKIALPTTAADKPNDGGGGGPDKFPPQQTLIAQDDGSRTQVTLQDTNIIGAAVDITENPDATTKTAIAASLLVQPAGQAKPDIYLPLQPTTAASNAMNFFFPSMRKLHLNKDIFAGAVVSMKLDGTPPTVDAGGKKLTDPKGKWSQTYPVRFTPEADDVAPATFDIAQSALVIVADPASGTGEARLNLSIDGKVQVKLKVDGADWDNQAGQDSLLTQSQIVDLKLGNLAESTPVKVTATGLGMDGKVLATKTILYSVKNGQKQAQN